MFTICLPPVTSLTLGLFPLLLLSFFLLHLYYTRCHPWLTQGVSVGFQPQDRELWRPSPNLTAIELDGEWFCDKLEIISCGPQVYLVLGAGERGTAIHTWIQGRGCCQRAGGLESSLLSFLFV